MQNSEALNGVQNHGRTPCPYVVPGLGRVHLLGVIHDLDRVPPSRRRQHRCSDNRRFSSEEEDRSQIRKTARRYKKRKGRDESLPIDGHTLILNQILQVQLQRHFVKLTDMKYDGSTDPHEHLRDIEHQMIYE
ncbi:hypothetical protein PIB30_060291 [Stylosanthes scabra]|uniref:Uncharacterized protein n=1 Tax=Stylosanthes scabra TaxID=79078 RepID=A0ABU6VK31_9FABA|nr:hypothetical protein [Stylosanthes scabra]